MWRLHSETMQVYFGTLTHLTGRNMISLPYKGILKKNNGRPLCLFVCLNSKSIWKEWQQLGETEISAPENFVSKAWLDLTDVALNIGSHKLHHLFPARKRSALVWSWTEKLMISELGFLNCVWFYSWFYVCAAHIKPEPYNRIIPFFKSSSASSDAMSSEDRLAYSACSKHTGPPDGVQRISQLRSHVKPLPNAECILVRKSDGNLKTFKKCYTAGKE